MTRPTTPSEAPARVGFVGKLPSQGDFVRQHIGDKVGSALELWLQTSTQNLYQSKREWPERAVRFVFSADGCASTALGVVMRSHDQVGRSFPLAIFSALPAGAALAQLSALPAAYGSFFARAEAVLAASTTLVVDALREAVLALTVPTQAELSAAVESTASALRELAATALLSALFQGDLADASYYALSTFCAATTPVRAKPSLSAATVLDCPLGDGPALAAWLELARRQLVWRDFCPTLLWHDAPSARLLLALGAASDQLVHFLADASHPSARLWPLRTQRSEAIARARASLGHIASSLERDVPVSVAALWDVLQSPG